MSGINLGRDVQVIPVVVTRLLRRGSGKTSNDPVRTVTQFWTLDGDLLAEKDTWEKSVGVGLYDGEVKDRA